MKKKSFLFCSIAFLLSFNFLFADEIPDKFYIKERWLSLTTTFDIKDDYKNMGVVYRKFFTLLPEYHLEDALGQFLAKGRMRFFALGAKFDIYDHRDEILGLVEQKLFTFFPTFEIRSPSSLTLAKARLNFWATTYTISDPIDNHVIATLSRPFLFFKTNWTMTIFDKEAINERNIHPHMLLVIAAFQVDREYWQAQRNQNNDDDNILSYHSENLDNSIVCYDLNNSKISQLHDIYGPNRPKARLNDTDQEATKNSLSNVYIASNNSNSNKLHDIYGPNRPKMRSVITDDSSSNQLHDIYGPNRPKAIPKYLHENLLAKKDLLADVEVEDKDFEFIEDFTNSDSFASDDIYFSNENEKFYHIATKYIDLLDSNDLSKKQKKALYLMLDQRFNL